MKKLLFILFIVVSVPAFSQNLTTLEYSMGFATGDMGDFIDKPSFRGFTLDYRRLVQPNVGVGFEGGWNVFYTEESYAVYTQENVSLGGRQFRYQNQVPLFVLSRLLLPPGRNHQSICGIGIGNNVLET